jgi:elongation factor P
LLEYNEIKEGKVIIFENDPYEVLSSHVFRKQQRKPVNATKLRNLITGSVTEHSFHVSDKADEAELDKKPAKFIYQNRGEYWFSEPNDPSKRFTLKSELLGDQRHFMNANMLVDILMYEDRMLSVRLPIKVDLKVIEAPPSIKGNTAQGGTKVVKLETGAEINAPLFVNEGDMIRVNTQTGEYVERA